MGASTRGAGRESSFERELKGRVYIGQKMDLKVYKAGLPRK
jgi:hypothetical protein